MVKEIIIDYFAIVNQQLGQRSSTWEKKNSWRAFRFLVFGEHITRNYTFLLETISITFISQIQTGYTMSFRKMWQWRGRICDNEQNGRGALSLIWNKVLILKRHSMLLHTASKPVISLAIVPKNIKKKLRGQKNDGN